MKDIPVKHKWWPRYPAKYLWWEVVFWIVVAFVIYCWRYVFS